MDKYNSLAPVDTAGILADDEFRAHKLMTVQWLAQALGISKNTGSEIKGRHANKLDTC